MYASKTTVGLLLFFSGFSALIYQVGWLREMRLVFGASTAASAAVLAIFMGGLGLGGAILGRRADRRERPLALYAHLELGVAGAALVSPFLLAGVREAYIWLGGSSVLGSFGATLVRLVLAAVVLGPATFLMGGTLPAAARAVELPGDRARGRLAWLYGLNTLGAVTGALVATFFLLEILGTQSSLFVAALLNALVGLSARAIARGPVQGMAQGLTEEAIAFTTEDRTGNRPTTPPGFVYLASGLVGFSFFLMEMAWYRLLGPLLGGSTYTFGLILAVALLGIGLGAALYSTRDQSFRPTPSGLALTCGFEALALAWPYALGDQLAIFAALIRPLSAWGMSGQALGWTFVTLVVVFPAAFIAGYQFPLLVGLLGTGGRDVGRQTGAAYAWNTAGAMIGSLAGGFGILPLLSVTGTWRLVALLLALLGLGAVLVAARGQTSNRPAFGRTLAWPLILAGLTVTMLMAQGPTAAWQHSPIGAGRVDLTKQDHNGLVNWLHQRRRAVTWAVDGVESSVGLENANGLSFMINGKSDGNAWADSTTQVMAGLVGAARGPAPRTAAVIGLGTGSTAGWLAALPGIDRVDVLELEPAVLEVARRSAPVNHGVLTHPKVHVTIADAREAMLTTRNNYDLIFSEPSNPYRAGVASLYTLEFYRAVASRLTEHGSFVQWVQAYEVDTETVATILSTLAAVFPAVEIWQTNAVDMLLVCSREERSISVPETRALLAREPYRSAMLWTWGAVDLEGFLARFVARPALARFVAGVDPGLAGLNTDDRMLVEFGFARTVGRPQAFNLKELRVVSRAHLAHRPLTHGGEVDWRRVDEAALMNNLAASADEPPAPGQEERQRRLAAQAHFLRGEFAELRAAWKDQPLAPEGPLETAMLAEARADAGDPESLALVEKLRAWWPIEAEAIRARYLWRANQPESAVAALVASLERFRREPSALTPIMDRTLTLAGRMAQDAPRLGPRLEAALSLPFCVNILEDARLQTRARIAGRIDCATLARTLEPVEPNVPWELDLLDKRWSCYQALNHPRAASAGDDLKSIRWYSALTASAYLPRRAEPSPSQP